MLVLTRRPGEQIVIGNDIRVTVVSVGPGRVKIGIEAPANVRVDRQEIHERIVQEQTGFTPIEPAATSSPATTSDEPTPIVVGESSGPKIHNRIADRLPTGGLSVVDGVKAPVVANRLLKHRLPRKPR